MSTDDDRETFPKSMRHRRILDAAEDHPDASIEDIASMVPSATTELVEHVFDDYGDPAADGSGDEAVTESDEHPSHDDLSEKQRVVLALIAADPEATQEEIGEKLDVTSATVSNRVNSIEGFDWGDRASFVEDVFDGEPDVNLPSAEPAAENTATEDGTTDSRTTDTKLMAELDTSLERLEERVAELESKIDRTSTDCSAFDDPELVHKIVHACMESDAISESEELRILEGLM